MCSKEDVVESATNTYDPHGCVYDGSQVYSRPQPNRRGAFPSSSTQDDYARQVERPTFHEATPDTEYERTSEDDRLEEALIRRVDDPLLTVNETYNEIVIPQPTPGPVPSLSTEVQKICWGCVLELKRRNSLTDDVLTQMYLSKQLPTSLDSHRNSSSCIKISANGKKRIRQRISKRAKAY
eukprot:m.84785 g.84785  ORF g.84785 m.84785 type:complete len:181 (+) comp12980_c0_seq3:99-641(+)